MHGKLTVGWREWVALPELNIPAIKAKVDTGARTSALHAIDIDRESRDDSEWVSFTVQPLQKMKQPGIRCLAPLVEERVIRDSGGHEETRYVVNSLLKLGDIEKRIELTLTSRHDMRFRMLLGRTALRLDTVVDPGVSYSLGKINVKEYY